MKKTIMRALKMVGALFLLVLVFVGYSYLRHLVYWLPTEEVTFRSADGVELAGTLLKPEGEGSYAAVVMLHGSGPESRSGPGYRVLSNAIARNGVAVLFYDKRGVGESGGEFESAAFSDFIADASASVEYLAQRDDIDGSRIGLHANSEGGWFAPEIAVRTGRVSYIFNRVSPPFAWMENVIWEVRNDALAAGVPESGIDEMLDIRMRIWQYYVDTVANPSLAEGPVRDAIKTELARVIAEVPNAANEMPNTLAPYDAALYQEYADEVGYDPVPYLEQLDIPMTYTYGETDINVPTIKAVAFLEQFREQHNKDIDIFVYDGVGHPMAAPRGFMYAGYVPELMDTMRDFYSAWALR